jgi:exonuclease VII small subunit
MPELSPATLNQMFFGTAWAALAVAVLLILWLLFRRGPQKVISEEPGQSKELTDMMILFQTMREVLHEQKALARDFNQSLDRKVQVIREASNMAVEEYKRLAELQRELHDQIEEARQALRDMMRQAQGKRSSELGKPDGDRSDAVEKRDVPEPPKPETPRPILLARPEAEITTAPTGHGDMIDTWVGLDFGDDSDDGEPPEATLEMPEVPEEPEDPMTVRSALRAILNLSESVA